MIISNMPKKFKIAKRLTSILLIVLMTAQSYATVTSDDGSEFVTKTEFDSLTKDFNDKMNEYQAGLNAKIDSAISGYIAGMSAVSMQTLPSILPKMTLNDRTFINNSAMSTYNPNGDKWDLSAGTFGTVWFAQTHNSNPTGVYTTAGFVRVNSNSIDSGSLQRNNTSDESSMWKVKYKKLVLNGVTYYTPDTDDIKLTKPEHIVECKNIKVQGVNAGSNLSAPSTSNWVFTLNQKEPGIEVLSNGQEIWGIKEWGLNHSVNFSDSSASYDYLKYIPSTEYANAYTQYGIDYENRFVFDSASLYEQAIKGSNAGVRTCGWEVTDRVKNRTGDNFTYKFYTQKSYSHNVYDWINYSASLNWGEAIKKIEGIPICRSKEKGKITIPLIVTNSSGRCTLAIRTSPFDRTSPSTTKSASDIYYNDNVEGEVQIELEQTTKTDTVYWLKILPNSEGQTTSIELKSDIQIAVESSS